MVRASEYRTQASQMRRYWRSFMESGEWILETGKDASLHVSQRGKAAAKLFYRRSQRKRSK
jgi:hypothetical protein